MVFQRQRLQKSFSYFHVTYFSMSSTTITTSSARKRKPSSVRRVGMKRQRLFGPSRGIQSVRGVIPARTIVKMRYVENWASPGTIIDHLWNLNSIYDPNRSGTGHQPYGHDTYLTLYNRYRVIACRVRLRPVTFSTGSVYKQTFVANNTVTLFSNPSLAAESPNAKTIPIASALGPYFSQTFYPNQVCGATKVEYMADDRYMGVFGSDPSEVIVLHVVTSGFNDAAPAANDVMYVIELEYTVELFDRKELAQS